MGSEREWWGARGNEGEWQGNKGGNDGEQQGNNGGMTGSEGAREWGGTTGNNEEREGEGARETMREWWGTMGERQGTGEWRRTVGEWWGMMGEQRGVRGQGRMMREQQGNNGGMTGSEGWGSEREWRGARGRGSKPPGETFTTWFYLAGESFSNRTELLPLCYDLLYSVMWLVPPCKVIAPNVRIPYSKCDSPRLFRQKSNDPSWSMFSIHFLVQSVKGHSAYIYVNTTSNTIRHLIQLLGLSNRTCTPWSDTKIPGTLPSFTGFSIFKLPKIIPHPHY